MISVVYLDIKQNQKIFREGEKDEENTMLSRTVLFSLRIGVTV